MLAVRLLQYGLGMQEACTECNATSAFRSPSMQNLLG